MDATSQPTTSGTVRRTPPLGYGLPHSRHSVLAAESGLLLVYDLRHRKAEAATREPVVMPAPPATT